MSIHRSVLCGLALFVAMPAEAVTMPDGRVWIGGVKVKSRVAVGDDGTATSVTATVKSDAGSEDLTLVESDAWLHGAAAIQELPKTEATLTLTLYDEGSASLMSFSGTLGTDGEVSLTADAVKDTSDSSTCALKTGCTESTIEASATALDIEVLAGEVFAASGGYELAVDLAGADTHEVAYATFAVTESTEVTTCDKVKGCVTTGSSSTTKAEVGWDEIGAVWEGELATEPEGVIDIKVTSWDGEGVAGSPTKVTLGVPWIDGGEGVNVLGVDDDPLTTVGVFAKRWNHKVANLSFAESLAIVSEGWTSTTVPVSAKVELTDGDTITIPVNSYQRVGRRSANGASAIEATRLFHSSSRVTVTSGGLTYYDSAKTEMGEPSCSSGTCFRFIRDESSEGDIFVHCSKYGSDATELPDSIDVTITAYDDAGEKLGSESLEIEFDDDITAVFANEISFSEDPLGLDLSGNVSLLGAADSKGKQETLAKGKFYGSFSRDGEGDLSLVGADKNEVSSSGSVVVAGSAVALELTDTNKDGVIDGPPIVALYGDIIMSSMKLDDFND